MWISWLQSTYCKFLNNLNNNLINSQITLYKFIQQTALAAKASRRAETTQNTPTIPQVPKENVEKIDQDKGISGTEDVADDQNADPNDDSLLLE